MPYTPPVGTADLDLGSVLGYALPVGIADLDLGHLAGGDRTAILAGETLAPVGLLSGFTGQNAILAGETLAPIGLLSGDYDPNLLSDIVGLAGTRWQEGESVARSQRIGFRPAPFVAGSAVNRWRPAPGRYGPTVAVWRDSARLDGSGRDTWQTARPANGGTVTAWTQAPFGSASAATVWQDGARVSRSATNRFRVRLPLLAPDFGDGWQDGLSVVWGARDRAGDGLRLIAVEIEVWQQAGYPGNAPRPGPPPPEWRPPWGTDLRLACPLPVTPGAVNLNLGRVPCLALPVVWIPVRRSYMITNSAILVRYPDLTPLPCTDLSIETDAESWCWGLTATLAGPDAYDLVKPNPLATEVQATINGKVWRFLLDEPNRRRGFNSDRVSLRGRSRSAWLAEPYTPPTAGVEASAREVVQLAEQALDSTGWTLVWNAANWLVPAGRYAWSGSPIERLKALVAVTGDGLYSDPALAVLTAYPRWPVASWLLDGAVIDVSVPESALLSLAQTPTYAAPLNGVYVSGTTHGALALIKIAGTDGALQPPEPILHELLCDPEGVAATARGLNALSDSGSGTDVAAELLMPASLPVLRPGLIVELAGIKGVSRSVRIAANWSDGLTVHQTVTLERREA